MSETLLNIVLVLLLQFIPACLQKRKKKNKLAQYTPQIVKMPFVVIFFAMLPTFTEYATHGSVSEPERQ